MPLYATPYVALACTKPSFLVFYSSIDPSTGKMWCPDCRDVEQVVLEAFDAPDKPKAMIHWVGQRAEWRDPKNEARVNWNVQSVPTILRIEHGKETARLVESEILDRTKLERLLAR